MTLVLVFRNKIARLLDRTKKIAVPGGTEWEFSDVLELAKEQVSAVPELAKPVPRLSSSDPLSIEAETDPAGAVMTAYRGVEQTIREAIIKAGGPETSRIPNHVSFMRDLSSRGILPESLLRTYDSLRQTRNVAAHSDGPITSDEAKEYRNLVVRFLGALRPILDKWANDYSPRGR
ncbi:hypothetical protein X736_04660 [Mesorhizobium sp. L2C089B000]|nr:hypothetical protein X736_04660 [Mesorhizobium sp. L2C089B000]